MQVVSCSANRRRTRVRLGDARRRNLKMEQITFLKEQRLFQLMLDQLPTSVTPKDLTKFKVLQNNSA